LADLVVPAVDIHISESFIFFRTVDEDFFSQVNILPRAGTEKEDFLRLSDILSP
jgi:hypothetical protein